MTKKMKHFALLISSLIIISACNNSSSYENKSTQAPAEGTHKITVKEVVHASSYTYLRADENGNEVWIAINKQDVPEGETMYYRDALEMHNFESKDLQRTFETILFVQDISKVPVVPDEQHMHDHQQQPMTGNTENIQPVLTKIDVDVDIPQGGVAIGELYANAGTYKDKSVVVRGKVTKVNPGIMDRNWIHIQDGTGDEEHFDLTVTTQTDIPKVGEIVTYKGTFATDIDFGMGYEYDILLEKAERVK
ncbi:MAG: hypothetical protein KDC05_03020 [Bacteroidales bacterium]|nr:hypothetical protein [Bacteroidales bacterium]